MGSTVKEPDMLDYDFITFSIMFAQVREENGRYIVSKGLDENKDQSYVLWGLSQDCLKRTIFPMGKYHKKDIVLKCILDRGYVDLNKSESYEICFYPR